MTKQPVKLYVVRHGEQLRVDNFEPDVLGES